MPPTPAFPRWIQTDADHNLREVGQGLYVGAELSPGLRPAGPWSAVVDLYGTSELTSHGFLYQGSRKVLTWPFDDGDHFPSGCLDNIEKITREQRAIGPVLLHCQAGLSRSCSAAYAMMRLMGFPDDEALRRVKVYPEFPRAPTLASAHRWTQKRLQEPRTSRLPRMT